MDPHQKVEEFHLEEEEEQGPVWSKSIWHLAQQEPPSERPHTSSKQPSEQPHTSSEQPSSRTSSGQQPSGSRPPKHPHTPQPKATGSSQSGGKPTKHPQLPTPSGATSSDCRLLSPFVEWKLWSENNEDVDKFALGKMRGDTLLHLLRRYIEPTMRACAATYDIRMGEELNCRPLMCHLWPIIGALTQNLTQGQEVNDEDEEENKEEDNENEDDKKENEENKDDEEFAHFKEQQGLPSEAQERENEEIEVQSQDSHVHFRAEHEQSLSSMESAEQAGFVDFCLYVYNKMHLSLSCKALVDCKGPKLTKSWYVKRQNKPGTVYQLFVYAHYHSLDNAKVGRFGDIHIVGMNSKKYGLAVLETYGVVSVEDGMITDKAFAEFKDQEKRFVERMKKKGKNLFHVEVTKHDLEVKMQEVKDKLSPKGFNFRDGLYPVGTIYVERGIRDWDDFHPLSQPNPEASCMLLEYLLRVLVGERVCSFSPQDIDKLIKEKQESHGLKRERLYDRLTTDWDYNDMVKIQKSLEHQYLEAHVSSKSVASKKRKA